jgi:8-oxo-(d)GTP phosphatase
MPDGRAAEEIRAAGAVLWRPSGSGTQVALVHRPKYDDWSLPKGKLEPGEHVLLAARREVWEETGLRVTLGLRLPATRYLVDGQPKLVDYWAARADPESGQFTANNEVDRLEWLDLERVGARLSYDHDARLLEVFGSAPRPTAPLIVARHASAGSKSDWPADDQSRPLDSRGRRQAAALADLMRCFGTGRVLSSPAERCLATVRPYAAEAGKPVEAEEAFGVGGAARRVGRAEAAARAAASAAADPGPVVICAHRENLPLIVAAACAELGAQPPAGPPLRKGGFWVLHRAAGRLAGAEQHQPDDPELARAGAGHGVRSV